MNGFRRLHFRALELMGTRGECLLPSRLAYISPLVARRMDPWIQFPVFESELLSFLLQSGVRCRTFHAPLRVVE